MRYIQFVLFIVCIALLFVFACGKVELQIDSGGLRPDEPPSITLFAPRDGLVADHTNKFVFEWAANVPYVFTLYVSLNEDLADPLVERSFDDPSFMQDLFINTELPLTTGDKARVFWAVRGDREDGAEVWSVTNAINPELDPLSIVISEVCYRVKRDDGKYYSNGDFVELYNNTQYFVDVGGWTLRISDKNGVPRPVDHVDIPFGFVIPPQGFLVLANKSAQIENAFDPYSWPLHTRLNLEIPSVASTSAGFQFEILDRHGDAQDICNSTQGVSMVKEPATASHPAYSSFERVYPITDGMLLESWALATRAGSSVLDEAKNMTWATPGEINSVWTNYP
ncbi:MAG: lamin tail domain-containing protein [Spirochaetota bacterium]|jgi:hypothetical protein|nr:lamin tail domain-containing protein [Spirochaetota bacterium]